MSALPSGRLVVLPDRTALSRAAAERFVEAARRAVEARGAFTVALSGGSTPRDLYELLATPPWRDAVEWPRVHVFWGDERCVPPEDPRSNYRLAHELLLRHVPVPASHVHRMVAERADREAAAAEYAALIRRFVPADEQGVPRFDLVLLGLGDDGHTASLLPGSALIAERGRLVAVTDRQREGMTRLTITPPLIEHAGLLLFLVAGADKAPALREVLLGEERPDRYPAQLARGARGDVVWLVDQAAAAELPPPESETSDGDAG